MAPHPYLMLAAANRSQRIFFSFVINRSQTSLLVEWLKKQATEWWGWEDEAVENEIQERDALRDHKVGELQIRRRGNNRTRFFFNYSKRVMWLGNNIEEQRMIIICSTRLFISDSPHPIHRTIPERRVVDEAKFCWVHRGRWYRWAWRPKPITLRPPFHMNFNPAIPCPTNRQTCTIVSAPLTAYNSNGLTLQVTENTLAIKPSTTAKTLE